VGRQVGDSVYEFIRSISSLSSSEITEIMTKIGESYSSSTKEYFRLVGSEDALRLGVNNIDPEHYYIVDYYNIEVYGPIAPELAGGGG
ncbi:MAG: hypothetical protein K6E74_04985, partial [Bacilli bacterium]|nr:hypothetical protein [Bacilli bacterium]